MTTALFLGLTLAFEAVNATSCNVFARPRTHSYGHLIFRTFLVGLLLTEELRTFRMGLCMAKHRQSPHCRR